MLARRHRGTRGFASAFLRGGGAEPQMSVKWGATGLRDPLQKEADMAVLSPPPRIMNAHMDAFMISKLQEARDRGPEQFQALLNAKAAHTYDDVLQAEANVQNEKFSQDFFCYLQGKDPDNRADPAYIKNRLSEAGTKDHHGPHVGPGIKEWMSTFIDRKEKFREKMLMLRMGPHKAFLWGIEQFYLYYKYVLREAPYVEDQLLPVIDKYFPDHWFGQERAAAEFRSLDHRDPTQASITKAIPTSKIVHQLAHACETKGTYPQRERVGGEGEERAGGVQDIREMDVDQRSAMNSPAPLIPGMAETGGGDGGQGASGSGSGGMTEHDQHVQEQKEEEKGEPILSPEPDPDVEQQPVAPPPSGDVQPAPPVDVPTGPADPVPVPSPATYPTPPPLPPRTETNPSPSSDKETRKREKREAKKKALLGVSGGKVSKGTAASSSRAGSPERGSTAAAQQAYQELDHDMKMRLVRIDNALMSLPREQQAVVQQEIQAALETKATTEDVQRREGLKARTAASETTSTQYRSKSLQDKGKQKKSDKVGKARKEAEENVALVTAHVNAESGQSTSATKRKVHDTDIPLTGTDVPHVPAKPKTSDAGVAFRDEKLKAKIDKEELMRVRFLMEVQHMQEDNLMADRDKRERPHSQRDVDIKQNALLMTMLRKTDLEGQVQARQIMQTEAFEKVRRRRADMNLDEAILKRERKAKGKKGKKGGGK